MRACVVLLLTLSAAVALSGAQAAPEAHRVVYEGTQGPGRGQRIVFLAGDEEYRSEETLPALARILARRFGFTATVIFTTNPATGAIDPDSSDVAGLDLLKTADLLVVFLRFRDFPDAEMRHVVDYLGRGGPVVGLRTATHAFQIKRADAPFVRYSWDTRDTYPGGFGRQILGETWVSHYGTNHKQSSRLILEPSQASHPILRGVQDVWVPSGGYTADPMAGSQTLARGRILDGMSPDARPATDKQEMPVAWARTYTSPSGRTGRVFTTTHGASEDLLNEGFRRMVVNACLWAAGLEAAIQPTADIDFVGPFHPSGFAFEGFVKGVRPADLAGWETPIPAYAAEQGSGR
jgi:type 1 glutamine amidotransferase